MVAVASARNMLSGMARKTGPEGGVEANLSARRVLSGIPAVASAQPIPFGDRLQHRLLMVVILWVVAAHRGLAESRHDEQHRYAVLVGIDELRHSVGKPDIGDARHSRLAREPRIAVGHRDDGALLHALDQGDFRHVDQRVVDGRIAGRRVEEDVFHVGRLELLDEEHPAGAANVAHRAGRGLGCLRAHRSERLGHRFRRNRAQSDCAQARHERATRDPVIEILLDQVFHGILLPRRRPIRASAACCVLRACLFQKL